MKRFLVTVVLGIGLLVASVCYAHDHHDYNSSYGHHYYSYQVNTRTIGSRLVRSSRPNSLLYLVGQILQIGNGYYNYSGYHRDHHH